LEIRILERKKREGGFVENVASRYLNLNRPMKALNNRSWNIMAIVENKWRKII
jgi:hypothetical protein